MRQLFGTRITDAGIELMFPRLAASMEPLRTNEFREINMTTFYVATLSTYVLVNAKDEAMARELGQAALQKMYAERGRHVPINIRTVRPAIDDEIELQAWHRGLVAREGTVA
jgi:hypothetical protein